VCYTESAFKTDAGIAGKDSMQDWSLARDCDASPTADLLHLVSGRKKGLSPQEDALVALAGRHVKWTSLAVQQQLIEPDSQLTT